MMSNTLKKWLKTQLETLVSVQRCTFPGKAAIVARLYEPDMIVHLWTGARVHIYILTEVPKTRLVKTILQSDTGIGVGTLFIVSPDMLPAANQTFKPEEWLLVIHALTNERVYTYPSDGSGLLQIHFEKLGTSDNYRAVYSPPVAAIHQLRYARVTVKPPAVKGFWMLADFGADPFWKKEAQNGSYYQHSVPPRPRYTHHTPPHTQQRSHTQHNEQHHYQQQAHMVKNRLERCYEVLGLEPDATRDEVKAAFRRLAFVLHPDVSQLEKQEAEARFKALSEAYEYIKSANNW